MAQHKIKKFFIKTWGSGRGTAGEPRELPVGSETCFHSEDDSRWNFRAPATVCPHARAYGGSERSSDWLWPRAWQGAARAPLQLPDWHTENKPHTHTLRHLRSDLHSDVFSLERPPFTREAPSLGTTVPLPPEALLAATFALEH